MKKPELLAPAGNLQKLKIAFDFGADAVYVGGKVFGLRKYADNFTDDELRAGVAIARERGKKVYVVLNGFAHDVDLAALESHLKVLDEIGPDGFIISDWAVADMARRHTRVPLHASTQASITNWRAVSEWVAFGASRVILAREVSIEDCKYILEKCPTELEIFIHGAMCASYSGKCVISNYSAGRDSNRGGCIQSCRHEFRISDDSGQADTTHIMNAKDLMGIRYIQAAIDAGIDSLKIEGRMKSNLYVANACRTYRDAIDYLWECKQACQAPDLARLTGFEERLNRVSNRTFSSGGLGHRPGGESIHYEFGGYTKSIDIVGTVIGENGGQTLVESKSPIRVGDQVQFLTPIGTESTATVSRIIDLDGAGCQSMISGAINWIEFTNSPPVHTVIVQ